VTIYLDRVSDSGFAKEEPHQIDVIVIVIDREDDTTLMAMCFHSDPIDSDDELRVSKMALFELFARPIVGRCPICCEVDTHLP
jgi:hypothetical protein